MCTSDRGNSHNDIMDDVSMYIQHDEYACSTGTCTRLSLFDDVDLQKGVTFNTGTMLHLFVKNDLHY